MPPTFWGMYRLLFKLCWRCTGIYHRTKDCSFPVRKSSHILVSEVGWSSPSIQPTFYRPELIAGLAFTLLSKYRATTRTRHILLYKICYHWHSTRYHLLFLFRLLHRPQGARSVASHSSLDVNFKMLLSLQERSKYVLSYSVHRCFPLVLNFFFWSSKIFYGWYSPYH